MYKWFSSCIHSLNFNSLLMFSANLSWISHSYTIIIFWNINYFTYRFLWTNLNSNWFVCMLPMKNREHRHKYSPQLHYVYLCHLSMPSIEVSPIIPTTLSCKVDSPSGGGPAGFSTVIGHLLLGVVHISCPFLSYFIHSPPMVCLLSGIYLSTNSVPNFFLCAVGDDIWQLAE
jgi:hypothetical protein